MAKSSRTVLSRALSITALAALALALPSPSPITAATFNARGPICESIARVGSTTFYSCNGGTHTALDISNQSCNERNHRGMILGSVRYNLFGGCAANCANPPPNPGCNGGAGNYFQVNGANGWQFRSCTSTPARTCSRAPATAARWASSAPPGTPSEPTRTRTTASSARARARGTRASGRRAARAGSARGGLAGPPSESSLSHRQVGRAAKLAYVFSLPLGGVN